MKNRNRFFLLILVFLLSFLFFSNTEWSEKETVTSYEYTGLNGDIFHFNISQINENTRHVLEHSFVRDGILRSSKIPFRYSPMELEEIYMEGVKFLILNSEVIYISRDHSLDDLTNGKDGVALLTLSRVLDDEMDPDIYEFPVGIALTSPVEDVFSPVVGCDYANLEARVIELRVGVQNAIYREGDYCVIMEFAEGEDPIKVATKLTYHMLDIM
tara:strand:+ start:1842 stop:2483 length:642 start_codon:yes stop_codon:yes gene_type:complete